MRHMQKFERLIPQIDAQVTNFQNGLSNQQETIHVFWNVLKSYFFLLIGQVIFIYKCLFYLHNVIFLCLLIVHQFKHVYSDAWVFWEQSSLNLFHFKPKSGKSSLKSLQHSVQLLTAAGDEGMNIKMQQVVCINLPTTHIWIIWNCMRLGLKGFLYELRS